MAKGIIVLRGSASAAVEFEVDDKTDDDEVQAAIDAAIEEKQEAEEWELCYHCSKNFELDADTFEADSKPTWL